jgi:hypothetical protein
MKILMVGNFGKSYGQTTDEIHIANGFRNLGIEVFQNDESKLPEVDLVLCFKSNRFGVEDVKRWKTLTNAPVWIWSFDNMERFSWFYPIAKECDLWLGEELCRMDRFKREGLPFYYFPYHAVPKEIFKKIELPKIYDVVFTGTPYDNDYKPNKFELLRRIQEKFNLTVFGNNKDGWKAQGINNVFDGVFDEELSKIYSQSKIVIAISNVQCEGYWSIRTSQSLMCGAFTLSRFTPQMEKELKDNVVYFQDIDDCLEKIDYYLTNEEERQKIANKGYEYAQKYLTNEQRLLELIIIYENRKSITTSTT